MKTTGRDRTCSNDCLLYPKCASLEENTPYFCEKYISIIYNFEECFFSEEDDSCDAEVQRYRRIATVALEEDNF